MTIACYLTTTGVIMSDNIQNRTTYIMTVTAEGLHLEWTRLQVPTWRSGWHGAWKGQNTPPPSTNQWAKKSTTPNMVTRIMTSSVTRLHLTSQSLSSDYSVHFATVIHSDMNYCVSKQLNLKNADLHDKSVNISKWTRSSMGKVAL